VSIVTRLWLDDRGLIADRGIEVIFVFLLFTVAFRSALRSIQSSIQWVPGAIFPALKLPGIEADHSASV
jgi:hypothetical protein